MKKISAPFDLFISNIVVVERKYTPIEMIVGQFYIERLMKRRMI